jgi:antirestriction protein ArdC
MTHDIHRENTDALIKLIEEGKAPWQQEEFNPAQQTEGIAAYPQYAERAPEERAMILKLAADLRWALKNAGMKIEHDQTDKAFYRAVTDTVHLPPLEKFQSLESYYSTAFHEAAKWTGHKDRMNREYGKLKGVREEFRANLSDCRLAAVLGLPIRHEFQEKREKENEKLIELLKKDKNELARASRDAEKIADYFLLSIKRALEQEKEQTQAGKRN